MAFRLREQVRTSFRRDQERRRGRRRRWASPPLVLNLAPMIDVTFLLLIFFSVTTTFKKAEGYLAAQLRHTAGRPTVPLPVSPFIVRIQQYGPNPGDYRLRVDNFIASPATFGELTRFLRQEQGNPGFSDQTPVVIVPDPDQPWDNVVNCWNAALRAGCKNIAFGN